MQFAINWSPEAAQLLDEGRIEIDLFKCPDWPDVVTEARKQRPLYVHFPLSIGKGQYPNWRYNEIYEWLRGSDTRFVNCHINPTAEQFSADIGLEALSASLANEVQLLVDEFGAERVIIENSPHSAMNIQRGYLLQGTHPQIFQSITQETNCGFLLDIAHAVLTCDYTEQNLYDYLNALPVQRIRELHVTGIGTWRLGIRGDHMPLTEADWGHVQWVLAQIHSGLWATPQVMAYEYGGIGKLKEWCGSDKDTIAEHVPRLYRLAQSLPQPSA